MPTVPTLHYSIYPFFQVVLHNDYMQLLTRILFPSPFQFWCLPNTAAGNNPTGWDLGPNLMAVLQQAPSHELSI
jgi:hypothetical protein